MRDINHLIIAGVCFALCAALVLLLTGCAEVSFPMPRADLSSYQHCQDPDCVIDAIDALPAWQKECERPKFMEGYRSPSLRWMADNGRLELVEWGQGRSTLAALGYHPYGRAWIVPGKYGDIYRAEVYYTRDPGWHVLAHELMHVSGPCLDSGTYGAILNPLYGVDYTKGQKEIMKAEGVERWIDTTYYQNEDPFWHD